MLIAQLYNFKYTLYLSWHIKLNIFFSRIRLIAIQSNHYCLSFLPLFKLQSYGDVGIIGIKYAQFHGIKAMEASLLLVLLVILFIVENSYPRVFSFPCSKKSQFMHSISTHRMLWHRQFGRYCIFQFHFMNLKRQPLASIGC